MQFRPGLLVNGKLKLIRHGLFFLFSVILISSCSLVKSRPPINIIENEWSGEKVMFAEISDEILKTTNINRSWSPLKRKRTKSYYKFQKAKATVVGDYTAESSTYLVLELKRRKKYKRKKELWEIKDNSLPNHLYLLSDFEAAEAVVGTNIWLNEVNDVSSFFSYAEKPFNRFEKVEVVGVFPYQNGGKEWPLWLVISARDGRRGNVRYNGAQKIVGRQNYYFIEDPLPKNWDPETIRLVRNRDLELGMNGEQVRISQGNPAIINNTSSRHGVGQQWIYGDSLGQKTYMYFEYGKLSFIQE